MLVMAFIERMDEWLLFNTNLVFFHKRRHLISSQQSNIDDLYPASLEIRSPGVQVNWFPLKEPDQCAMEKHVTSNPQP